MSIANKNHHKAALSLLLACCSIEALASNRYEESIEIRAKRLPSTTHWSEELPLGDIPQSLSVTTDSEIEEHAPMRLEDIATFAPGTAPGVLNAGLSSAIMVRGFAVTRMRWNGLPDIQRLFVRDLHTVEKIEILRGPDAVLEGITSPGGAVVYRGKTPQFTRRHSMGLEAGDNGWLRIKVDSTGPLGERFAYRFVGASQDGNTNPGGFTQKRSHTLAGLSWRYHDHGLLRLESEYQRNARPFLFGTIRTPDKGVMYDKVYASPHQQANRAYDRQGVYWTHAATQQLTLAASYAHGTVQRDETLIGFWSIRNANSLWGYYTRYQDRYHQSNLRLEARLRFETPGLSHHLVIGRDDNRQHIKFTGVQNVAGFTIAIENPDFSAINVNTLPVTRRYNHEHYRDQAWYGGLRTSLGNAAHLTLGLRTNDYQIEADRTGAGLIPAAESRAHTWHAGLLVGLAENFSGHVALGTGIEPNRGHTRNGDFLAPQRSRQIEAGLRWNPSPVATVTSAAYRIQLENLPMRDPLDATALITTGSRQVQGLELSGDLKHGAWQLHANWNWLESRNLSKTANGQGDAFVNVPRVKASVRVGHDFSKSQAIPLRVWLAGNWADKRYGDAANSFQVSAYQRWDIGGDYLLAPTTRLRFGVRNLADKRYVEAITSASDVYQGPRRHAWVGIDHEL